MWFEEALDEQLTVRTSELVYIPAGVPTCYNPSSSEATVAILARTDPNELMWCSCRNSTACDRPEPERPQDSAGRELRRYRLWLAPKA